MDEKINEWKERWDYGDVKFVPEMFEMVIELQNKVQQYAGAAEAIEEELAFLASRTRKLKEQMQLNIKE